MRRQEEGMYVVFVLISLAAGVTLALWLLAQGVTPFVDFCDRLLVRIVLFFDELWEWFGTLNMQRIVVPGIFILVAMWLVSHLGGALPRGSGVRGLFFFVGAPGRVVFDILIFFVKLSFLPVVATIVYGVVTGLFGRLPEHLTYRQSLAGLSDAVRTLDEKDPLAAADRVLKELSSPEMMNMNVPFWQQAYRHAKAEELKRLLERQGTAQQEISALSSEDARARAELMNAVVEYLKRRDYASGESADA